MPDEFEHRLEAAKLQSTGQLLMKCARLFNEHAIARVRDASGKPFRAAHTTLFPHIDLQGIRLTALASRVGISKQAVAQLVDELQEMRVLERVPDPSDGRAKLIQFSREGRMGMFEGLGVLGELQAELAGEIGVETMAQLHAALAAMLPALQDRQADRAAHRGGRDRPSGSTTPETERS
jgi:DNA-binding MarR family transcriptional regulator